MSLKHMFTNVARKYDLLNQVLTLGLHKFWREACARECASGRLVVDLCCGTGDLSLQISSHHSSDMQVLGLDFNKEMLQRAMEKISERQKKLDHPTQRKAERVRTDIAFILADASCLPIEDESVDHIGISFSLRNLVYKNPKATIYLREIARALRRNGEFVCVETSQPANSFVRALFHLYCLKIVPLFGRLISGSRAPYKYLGMSAANFPSAQQIADLLKKSGFRTAFFKHLALGIVALYIATK